MVLLIFKGCSVYTVKVINKVGGFFIFYFCTFY